MGIPNCQFTKEIKRMMIQKSRVVHGNRRFPALTIWQDEQGIIWLHQNGQDVTYEAWEACMNEDEDMPSTDARMQAEIHQIADSMID
jgi:hypothetical protein